MDVYLSRHEGGRNELEGAFASRVSRTVIRDAVNSFPLDEEKRLRYLFRE